MNTKLIMIEGIPGSGKTTIANKVHTYLNHNGKMTNIYPEGCLHPADLAWCAYIPLNNYKMLLEKYNKIENYIKKYTSIEDDYAVIAYTQIRTDDFSFYNELSSFEVYDGRVPYNLFCKILLKRWKAFADSAFGESNITIFECAFLQNHIFELLGFYNADEQEIFNHLENLLFSVSKLNPTLIYLSQESITDTINRVSSERVASGPNPAWIDLISTWVENSPYGKKHKLSGFNGVINFLEKRKEIELNIISRLPAKSIVIQNKNFDWDNVWKQIETFLGNC